MKTTKRWIAEYESTLAVKHVLQKECEVVDDLQETVEANDSVSQVQCRPVVSCL